MRELLVAILHASGAHVMRAFSASLGNEQAIYERHRWVLQTTNLCTILALHTGSAHCTKRIQFERIVKYRCPPRRHFEMILGQSTPLYIKLLYWFELFDQMHDHDDVKLLHGGRVVQPHQMTFQSLEFQDKYT